MIPIRKFAFLVALAGLILLCPRAARAQNLTTVTASSIEDASTHKLSSGLLCFQATDGHNTPISFNVGGGGQVITTPFCTPVVNGAITSFQVPDPALTSPVGILYHVTVKPRPQATGQPPVLDYSYVAVCGSTPVACGSFDLDTYVPNLGPVSAPYIPVPGPTGANGPPPNYRGAYASGTTYAQGDAVSSAGILYFSLTSSNTGNTPASSPTVWEAIAGLGVANAWTAANTFGNVNSIIYVDGTKYTDITDAIAALPSTGGTVVLPPHYRETFTSAISLGSNSKAVLLQGMSDVKITCNVTDGTTCFKVYNGSGIVGPVAGNAGSANGNTGGFSIITASTMNVDTVITDEPQGSSGQPFLTLEHFFIYGNDGVGFGTVATGYVNLVDVLDQAVIRDVFVAQCKGAVAYRLATVTAGSGPYTLDSDWADCNNNAGARPLKITTAGEFNTAITILGGAYGHAGAGLPEIEVNSNASATFALNTIGFVGTYVENLADSSAVGIKLEDVSNVNLFNVHTSLLGGTGVDISQSASGLTRAIQISGLRYTSAGGNALNNHITGEVIGTSTVDISWYSYGDDNTGTPLSRGPIFSSSRSTQFGLYNSANDGLADVVIQPRYSTRKPLVIKNRADNSMTVQLDSGLTAGQTILFELLDRGTNEWQLTKDSGNSFELADGVNGVNRLIFGQVAHIASSGVMRLASNEKIGWRSADNTANMTAGFDSSDNFGWIGKGGFELSYDQANESASRTVKVADGTQSFVVSASLTTTAATSDAVTVQGATTSSHCQLTPTNASAATNIATTFISAKAANSVTVTHTATASMTYDIACSPN